MGRTRLSAMRAQDSIAGQSPMLSRLNSLCHTGPATTRDEWEHRTGRQGVDRLCLRVTRISAAARSNPTLHGSARSSHCPSASRVRSAANPTTSPASAESFTGSFKLACLANLRLLRWQVKSAGVQTSRNLLADNACISFENRIPETLLVSRGCGAALWRPLP